MIAILYCPSRRSAEVGAYAAGPLRDADTPTMAAKTDYAINGGDVVLSGGGGPEGLDAEAFRKYRWPSHDNFNGISFVLSMVESEPH